MDSPYRELKDIEVLPAHFPIPGLGYLAVNAFVIKGREPVLVDTGMGIDGKPFLEALQSVVDPGDLMWVWLTHDDADHTGNLQKVLEAAPKARLVVNSLAALRLSTVWPLSMERVHWINSGESIDVGDRRLTAVRPPLFDNPTTIGVHDDKSGAYFSADCFGALIPSPARSADDVPEGDLEQGMMGWASLDSPWLHMVDADAFDQGLDGIRRMAPTMIFSAHLPPARGKTERFLELLRKVPASTPSVAPNQSALEQILA